MLLALSVIIIILILVYSSGIRLVSYIMELRLVMSSATSEYVYVLVTFVEWIIV